MAIFLPTTPLIIERGGFAFSLKYANQLAINQAYLYNNDPPGVVRHITRTVDGEERTDFYKRMSDDDFVIFKPKLGDRNWAEFHPGELEPVKDKDRLDPFLLGQLAFGPGSLEYWAFRALFSVGVHHPEEEPFPKIVSTTNLQDRIE